MDQAKPRSEFLHDAGLLILPGQIRPRQGRAWLVDWQGTRGVLRRTAVPGPAARVTEAAADAAWLHAFLGRLAELGFPSPRPLPCFGGRSWMVSGGMLWEAVSYLPGRSAGWAAEPSMEEIGALLAHYHNAARRIEMTGQRPGALPLADVPAVLLSGRLLEAARLSPDLTGLIRRLAEGLARDLDGTVHHSRERLVIHGDFTNDNVIADGTPPRPAGVIDFALAHIETPLADIGYGLWRSGRPREHSDHLDLRRISQFLRGYVTTVPVPADEARVIPVYMRGRGLQMIAKRVRAGRAETGMLAQVQWLGMNAVAVGDALAAAAS
jgi:Ser/Thr protein kinase RdoA (MazF antagonist)